jgi:hypothetical protein
MMTVSIGKFHRPLSRVRSLPTLPERQKRKEKTRPGEARFWGVGGVGTGLGGLGTQRN